MSNTIPPSPYQPGSAAQPPVLAGREHLIRTAEVAVGGQGNRRDSFQVLYGPRGVGKTVLMDRYGAIARDGGWAVARHEARAPYDPIGPIIDELHRCERLTKRVQRELRELRERWGEETQQLNLGVYRRTAKRERPEPRPIEIQLARAVIDVTAALTSQDRGLLILIDEVQEIDLDTLGSFGPVIQDLQRRRDLSVMIVFGGLPDAPGIVTSAFTYGERMRFYPVENLTDAETAHALVLPARDRGRRYAPDALDVLIEATGGYPFFVQLFGDHTWQAAGSATTITINHVHVGLDTARHDNDRGLYRARWSKLPPGEQQYLAAMAHISTTEPVATGAIAGALGKKTTSASDTRARLLDRGILTARPGRVESSVPGFLDYVLSVHPAPRASTPNTRRRSARQR